jgi:excisionase family DNA binding protein
LTDRIDSVIEAPRGRHSEKPECVYELIERMYRLASKLELFARRRRPGWTAWGNEVPKGASFPRMSWALSSTSFAERLARRLVQLERQRPRGVEEEGGSPWMAIEAAAAYLDFPRQRLYRLTASGEIPHYKQEGRLLFHRAELDGWLRRFAQGERGRFEGGGESQCCLDEQQDERSERGAVKRARVERGIYRQENGTYGVYLVVAGKPRFKTVGTTLDTGVRGGPDPDSITLEAYGIEIPEA